MAENPFDAFDDSARPSAPGNPFDVLDDDAVVQKRVAENPDLQTVMSRFARSRVDGISATARMVPDPEAFTSLDERTRGKAVQGELQAAEDVDQRAQAAVRDAQARGDSATYGAAVEAASEAGRRLAQARKLDEDNRAGVVRQARPEQQLALGNAIAAQKKRVDYLNDQIEQADSNPAFLPEGRRVEDVRAELQTEMQSLYRLEAGAGYGDQRQAVADPSGLGEFVRGLTRGAFGTVPEMLGGAAKQVGVDGVADVLRAFGRGVRRDTAAEAAGEVLNLGEKGNFGKDLKNFVSAKFGEGLGTSLPIIAAYMAGGVVGGVGGSAALGIGQMRNSLEEAFAEQGVAFPEEHAARYVYLYGTAIGALDSLTEVTGMRALTGEAKRQVVRSIGRALAQGAARGAAMEGVTEALQEAVEMYGVTDATGKPLDYAELRRRMTEGFAAGAVPGAAFGAFTGAASNKAAFDIALEKAKELGFGNAPQKPQGQQPAAAPAEPAPTDQPPAATPVPADAAPVAAVDPVAVEQTGTAALDVVDSLIPDGVETDREMVAEAAAVAGDALGLEMADPAEDIAAETAAAAVEAEEQADAITLDTYLADGGSLSRSAMPTLARRMGVTEADLPALLDKAVDAGTLRKTAGGMYRRSPRAEQQAAPSEFRQAELERRAFEAIDDALNFGRQILPKGVTVEVADRLNVGGYELDALSDTKTGHIALAIYANNPKARIGHEGLHTLVTRGHVSPEELAILAETARTSGVWTAKAEAQYRDAYAGRANLDGLIDEEAAAHLVEARIRGQDFGQQANAIIDKIKKVLERIRKALQGRGFKTADDVLDALVSGEMAKREARAEWMRDAQSLFAIRQDQDAMAIDAEARQMMQDRAQEGVELPGGVRVQGVPLFAIRAFHGSPHDFDRFSMDKIGTGEGAQAFGHGLYFAESEGVAREYRKKLSAKTSSEAAAQELAESNGSSWGDMGAYERQSYIDEAQRRGLQASRPVGGRMYEVRINADPEDFLDWDKPLSQQSEKVRGAVGRLGPAASADGRPELFNIVSADGQVIQTHQPAERARKYIEANPDFSISRMAGAGELSIEEIVKRGYGSRSVDPVLMQIKFREAGIPGIRYLDQGSRSAGEGSRNYVVFDDKLIEIVAKDGVPIVRDEGQPLFAVRSDHLADGETYRSMGDGLYVSVRPGDSWGSVIRDGERTAVTVTAAPSRLMQWDATEQTPEVRRALDAVAIERSVDLTGKSGADVVAALDKKLGPDGASGALRDAGIQGSVRGGDYVLYDPSAVQVLAETPEYKRAEDAAVRAYYDDLRENETTYFWDKTEYDDAGDRLPLDDFYPSIYGSGWADIIPAAARAVEDGARALGFDLNLHDSANSNSRYGTIDINGEKKKVRVADHARQSRLHDSADFNISPGGITPFDFLEELVSLSQQGRQKATPQPVDLADYLPQLQEMAARLSDGVDPDDLVTMTPMLQDIASRYGAQIDTDTIARIAADIAGGADVQEVIAREMGGAAPLFAMRSDLDMSPEARKKRAEAWRFPAGQSPAGREVGERRWFHGANRADRIAKSGKFDPKRATSGPMAFFSDSAEVSSNYAVGKADTSIVDEGEIPNYFTVSPKELGIGGRSPISVERSWHFLTPEQKATILSRMRRVGYADIDQATGPWTLHQEGVEASLNGEHLEWLRKNQARGNPLAALRMMWLEGGDLVGREYELAEIYRLAGYPHRISQETAPWTEAPGVIPVYIRMVNPLDTHDFATLRERVIPGLEEAFKRDRSRKAEFGADGWDKNTRWTPKEWVAQLKEDVAAERNAYTWSSIPDKVTAELRKLGYDGIFDRGNKGGGGSDHKVAIPFDPQQVRSVNAAFDPAKADSPNLLYGLSDVARRFLPSRDEPLAGINSIVRDLAHDLGVTVRQGLTTPAAKKAKRQARKVGTDISSYYDPATGVLRVTSMSDLTAILTHAGEAIIRRYDAAKGRVDERGARDVMNPLERLIGRHAYGLLGTYRGKLFGRINPTFSGVHMAPVSREVLSQYLLAWHNERIATMNRGRDPSGYAKAQRDLLNARRNVARYLGKKIEHAIDLEQQTVSSVWGLVQGKVDIAEIRDYVDIRYNRHSKIKPPPPADPLDPETQRAAFGKWFTTYITDRPAAEAQDPVLFEAFEDLLDTTDPVLSAKLDDATDAILAYAKAEPVQIVTSMISSPKRFGNIATFFQAIDRDGLVPTLADGVRMLYRGGFDDLHPWYTAVHQLLETHRVNTGSKLDLEAAENAYKLLRIGRHSGAWAGRDLEDGIKARASNAPEGPSLVQALQMALGSDRATALDMSQGGRYAQFNAYLIARRAVRLWDRFYDGTLPNPPLNASRETAVATIQKLEGEFPSFVGAADLVYEFQTNLLKLQRDAGIITPETFDTLSKEPDYIPFIRDMTDKDQASSRVLRGAQSIIRKIKGSDRNIMDPIATIAQKVYETRQIIATNDAKLALLKLAEAAGPGGGAIAERLDPNTSKAMRVNLKDALRNAADEMGVSRADANALVGLAQELLGDQMTGTVFGKGQMNTAGQNITWVYENGIPVPIKLADGDLGNLMMQTLQTFGSETTNIIVEMMAVPAAITRATVTAHPSFILRNGFVDGLLAWMYDKQATPLVTQAKGFVAGLMETEKVSAYARSAGLMGGPSTSALDRLRFDRDVRDLVARGYQPKVWKSPGAFFKELARHPIRNIALMSEASETGTRARLYELAYDRAIKSGLNPREAAAEAAFYAHDYLDYSRHGSTVQKVGKLVPFMNAALQGMDRYARLLVAKGDYGSAWMPYLNYRLGRTETLELTEREKAELAQSVQAWMVSTLVMGGISMAVSLIWAMRGDDDLQDVPQEIRATHWVIPIDGVYHLVPKELPGIREALKDKLDGEALRLPKGFDNAWFANLIERLMVDARQSNPRWFENYVTDLSSILNPPMEPQALKLFYEMKTGKDFFGNRDIIPKWKQERFPEMMWDEYTSEFAKWAGKKTGTAPYYIDHAMKQIGTSWARDALSLNVPGLPWYDPTKPEKALDDYFIARRFLWKIGKGSEAAGKVREIMGPGDPMQGVTGRLFAPYSRLDAAAETYKEYLKHRDPASGSEFLDRLRPAERAYAILDANVEGDNAKMKMVHPIHRADKLLSEVAGVQKEILGNLFESRKRKKGTGELIPLNPSEKRAAIDILTQYKMMEAHNALVVAGETGYAQRALFDTKAVMEELRAAVPDVADEFEKRLKKAKVIPFQGVREQWPQLRQMLESAEVTALSKGGDKRGVAAKVREFYALAKTAE